jgi:putative transposase
VETQAWPWSSARAHLAGRDDGLARVGPMLDLVRDWPAFLAEGLDADAHAAIQSGERTGRPLGGADFVAALERDLGRTLARLKPGRKPKADVLGVSKP